MTIEQIALIISALSLLITVIGWAVTAYFQRQLLERQIRAENVRVIRQLYIPQRIQQLENIKGWLQEGVGLISKKNEKSRLSPKDRELLEKQYREWKSQFFKITSLFGIASKYPDGESLGQTIIAYYEGIVHEMESDGRSDKESTFASMIGEIFKGIDTISKGFEAIKGTDELIEIVATGTKDK